VVDLGSWPGGWLQVLAERVGSDGRVVGVDTRAVEPLADHVILLELDFTDPEAPERIAAALARPADAVVSDAAPHLSGVREVDRAALEELHEAALRVARGVLRPGGALVLKAFPGPEGDRMRKHLRSQFGAVSEVRPEGKRSGSREFYWVIRGGRPPPTRRRTRRGKRA
jgi:23S rRNA (uridine2552-2'-O)-methyltransferase